MSEGKTDGLVGSVVQGRYRVERVLGQGGMGTVYEAEHLLIGRRVALKTLNAELAGHPDLVERFRREARAASTIGHENIVDVTDMGELDDGTLYLVMEKLSGRELDELLEEEGALRVGRAVRIVRQVCSALGAAHGAGIVHRDLKPANVFVVQKKDGTEVPKVLDFGISKFRTSPDDRGLTVTGVAMGTPSYMSPEQAQGLSTVDGRTDVYAIGAILYVLLTKRLPFDAASYAGLMAKILADPAEDPSRYRTDLPRALADVILRCLEKDPDARYPSMDALADALAPFETIDGEPQLVAPPPETTAPPTRALRPEAPAPAPSARTTPLGPSAARSQTELPAFTPAPVETRAAATIPGARRRGVLLAGVGLLAAGGIAIAVAVSLPGANEHGPDAEQEPASEPHPAASAPEPPHAAEPAQTDEVRIRIRAVPSEARILIGGVEYPNPMDAMQPRSLTPTTVRLEADGYRAIDRVVIFDADRSFDFELVEERAGGGHRAARPAGGAPMQAEPTTPEDDEGMRREF